MTTSNTLTKLNTAHIRPISPDVSLETQKILELGGRKDWGFKLLGRAPMPSKPVYLREWQIIPAHLDTSPIPTRTLEREKTIYASGLRPKGFVVVHGAEQKLPQPPRSNTVTSHPNPPVTLTPALKMAAGAAGLLGLTVVAVSGLAVVAMAAASMAASLAVPAILIGGLAVLDPMMILITDDDCWIEIDRWWD